MIESLLSLTVEPAPPKVSPVEATSGLYCLTVAGVDFLYQVKEAEGIISVYAYQKTQSTGA